MNMKKTKICILALCICLCMIVSLVGCSNSNQNNTETTEAASNIPESSAEPSSHDETETHKIAVSVYSTTDEEVLMFRTYYQTYLENAFNVEFLYSNAITDSEQEIEFIQSAKAEGCEGLISFVLYDVVASVEECGDDFYLVVGNGTISVDELNAVKDNPAFLGVVGPSYDDEYNAGVKSIQGLAGEDGSKQTYALLSGGSNSGNTMHSKRTQGMLETLQNDYGFTLTASIDELLAASENTLAAENANGGKVYICPGYYYAEGSEARNNVSKILTDATPDVIASTMGVNVLDDMIAEYESTQNKDVKVGAIDCFSETNQISFSDGTLDYLVGKCPAMAAPAFVAMFNAITGYADIMHVNNSAFLANHPFWHADSLEQCEELRAAAENVYQNVFTTETLMKAMPAYTDGANYSDFENLIDILSEDPEA